jgi:hypothetical protein
MDNEASGDEATPPKRTSRSRFLRQLGTTLVAAVGAGVFAKAAFATVDCCWDPNCNSCTTSSGTPGHNCSCDCAGGCVNGYRCFPDSIGGCTACPC